MHCHTEKRETLWSKLDSHLFTLVSSCHFKKMQRGNCKDLENLQDYQTDAPEDNFLDRFTFLFGFSDASSFQTLFTDTSTDCQLPPTHGIYCISNSMPLRL